MAEPKSMQCPPTTVLVVRRESGPVLTTALSVQARVLTSGREDGVPETWIYKYKIRPGPLSSPPVACHDAEAGLG